MKDRPAIAADCICCEPLHKRVLKAVAIGLLSSASASACAISPARSDWLSFPSEDAAALQIIGIGPDDEYGIIRGIQLSCKRGSGKLTFTADYLAVDAGEISAFGEFGFRDHDTRLKLEMTPIDSGAGPAAFTAVIPAAAMEGISEALVSQRAATFTLTIPAFDQERVSFKIYSGGSLYPGIAIREKCL
ncbi:MAG: hypothetical protein CML31_15915 [Rhizobiales bacterium]|nr:hypothetical protein [Hyphomicrobiales bacterium]